MGKKIPESCPKCGGNGRLGHILNTTVKGGENITLHAKVDCPICQGSGDNPEALVECPVCKGRGTILCDVHEAGAEKVTLTLTCYVCHGKMGITPSALETYQQEQKIWCHCSQPTSGVYPEDGKCTYPGCKIYKHHVHCSNCGKILQIG